MILINKNGNKKEHILIAPFLGILNVNIFRNFSVILMLKNSLLNEKQRKNAFFFRKAPKNHFLTKKRKNFFINTTQTV